MKEIVYDILIYGVVVVFLMLLLLVEPSMVLISIVSIVTPVVFAFLFRQKGRMMRTAGAVIIKQMFSTMRKFFFINMIFWGMYLWGITFLNMSMLKVSFIGMTGMSMFVIVTAIVVQIYSAIVRKKGR